MAKVTSIIGKEPYLIELKSPSGNLLLADEPVEKGGKDKGFSPKELLASALAACTSATVRMYANRKEWPLEEVHTEIELERDETNNKTNIHRKIRFTGNLDEQQEKQLLAVANACPVHKILSNPIDIETALV